MRMRLIGIALAPVGAVLLWLGGWAPVWQGNGARYVLAGLHPSLSNDLLIMAFVLTPLGAAILAASLSLLTWPVRADRS